MQRAFTATRNFKEGGHRDDKDNHSRGLAQVLTITDG